MTPNRHISTPPRRAVWLLLAAAVLAVPGCAKWNLGDSFTLFESEPKPQTPGRTTRSARLLHDDGRVGLHASRRHARHQGLEAFYLDHLSKLPYVQSINSSVTVTVIKETTILPIAP